MKAVLMLLLLTSCVEQQFDDSDDLKNGKRSGLMIKTDWLTGCQYLVTTNLSITPRLDVDGLPICVKE